MIIKLLDALTHSLASYLLGSMAVLRLIITPIFVLLIIMSLDHSHALTKPSFQQRQPPPPYGGVRVGYWPSEANFSPSSVDTNYFTHINYAFVQPAPSTFNLEITKSDEKWVPEFINGLRNNNPRVTTLLAIGGGGNNPTVFSEMASSKQNRASFINSTIHVARKYGFDGLDLDWEFPRDEKDMSNLARLYKEWYKALFVEATISKRPRLLLTSAVYFNSTIALIGNGPRTYPIRAIRKYLDWASPMCFDYNGAWANETGFNAALFDPNSNISTKYGIRSWIESGVPAEKLVMGLALYGRAWELKDPNDHGVGAKAVGAAVDTDGSMDYAEILVFNKESGANVVYDEVAVSFYSYSGTTWVGYDDGPSITKKVQFARSMGLKGYFFWAIGKDKDWTISKQASNAWGY